MQPQFMPYLKNSTARKSSSLNQLKSNFILANPELRQYILTE
jgi:hypothetical protein